MQHGQSIPHDYEIKQPNGEMTDQMQYPIKYIQRITLNITSQLTVTTLRRCNLVL